MAINNGNYNDQNPIDPNTAQPGQFDPNQAQNQAYNQAYAQPYDYAYSDEYGPRRLSLFTLILKTFMGLVGGIAGSLILLLIFLASSSVLQPVLNPAESLDQINPVFNVVLMAMILFTSLCSSMLSPLLLSYTERERYPRMSTALFQIFIINLVIFLFVLPVYLATTPESLEFTAYAAGLQMVMVSIAASLIMEIVNDTRYPLLAVYSSLIGVLIATAVNLFLFQIMSSPTVLLFAAMPVIWASIGFFQACLAMIYNWIYLTWGSDFLSANVSYGMDYANTAQEVQEEEEAQRLPDDRDGNDFLKS
jgi:hypothetical protein